MAAEIMLLAVLLWASYTGACRKHREDRLKRERVRKYLEKRRLAVFLRTIATIEKGDVRSSEGLVGQQLYGMWGLK